LRIHHVRNRIRTGQISLSLLLILEELDALLRQHFHFPPHRVPRIWTAICAGELCCNGLPPITEIAASAEAVGVVIADLEEGDFFFGCQPFPTFPWCVAVSVVVQVEFVGALHAPRWWRKVQRAVSGVLEDVHWHRHGYQVACDDVH
jgi:uncharacterized protein YjeT (DUF2065 family)